NSKSVNRSSLGPDPSVAAVQTVFIRSRSSCHPRAMTTSTGLKMPMNRTNGSSRKASWTALRDRGTAALGCREGEIMTFDYCSPAEVFTAKRKGGSRQRLGYRFDSEEIHRLYESDDYPLGRRTG